MGVPKFYRWISERYPCLSEVITDSQIPEFDNLYLDMNGIIHNCSHPNDEDVSFRISEEQILEDIFAYIEKLYNIIRPQKVFFMAIDGVAPRAKMNQQRARRFMSARNAQEQMEAAARKGVELPTETRFDSNCITPGTPFMTRLHTKLADWVQRKVNNDPNWQGRRIYLSGHNCPGEGEHKIMDFIRAEKAESGYDANTRHCMYGLDADLIMLGMCSHEPHFSLLREEVTFNRPKPKKDDDKKKKKKQQSSASKRADANAITFHLLHLSLLREYLAWEFKEIESSLKFPYDMERVIDDWVLMGFLIGNDFIPHLPHVHIHDDALPLLYKTYIKVLPTLDGYINESGILNLPRFQEFLKAFAENDRNCFLEMMEDEEYMMSKRTRRTKPSATAQEDELIGYSDSDMSGCDEEDDSSPNVELSETFEEKRTRKRREARDAGAAFISSSEDESEQETSDTSSRLPTGGVLSAAEALKDAVLEPMEDDFTEALAIADFQKMDDRDFGNQAANCWTKVINNSFKRHKKNYYLEKMNYSNITKEELRDQAECYVRAIQWNLHYYYHGCVSWSWFYKHHYAPYISDVMDFHDMEMSFELSAPLRPFEQLLAVLPAASADCLPRPLQELMCDSESPIADFYPTDFSTDLNGKKNDWEAVVLIPFINCQRLLDAIHSKEHLLTAEEKSRNTHGPHILFTWDEESRKANRTLIDMNKFCISKEKVLWGLLPNVKLDIYFPGFPTMKHLRHTASLQRANVKVFQFASKKQSLVLKLEEPEKKEESKEYASQLLDKEILIMWPILKMAKVAEIWADGSRWGKNNRGEVKEKKLTEDEKKQFTELIAQQKERLFNRYAIDTSIGDRLIWIRNFIGLSYKPSPSGDVLQVVKQWASDDNLRPVLDCTVVTNARVEEGRRLKQLKIEQAYAKGNVVFSLSTKTKGFGWPSIVQSVNKNQVTGKYEVIVKTGVFSEVNVRPLIDNYEMLSMQWMDSHEASRVATINGKLFARITGTVFLWNEKREEVETGLLRGSGDKLNIGLGLKATKKQLEVADYTYRTPEGYWVYSTLCAQTILKYKNRFRDLFDFLGKNDEMDDNYFAEDIWSNEKLRKRKMEELKEFLEDLDCKTAEKQECGVEYADSNMIVELERAIKNRKKSTPYFVTTNISPGKIYKSDLYDSTTWPEPSADFLILDRVVVVQPQAFGIGKQGTVITVLENAIDVLFDEPIEGGYPIRGKLPNGMRLKKAAVINITYMKERQFSEVSSNKKDSKSNYQSNAALSSEKTKKGGEKQQKQQEKKSAVLQEGPYVSWEPKKKEKKVAADEPCSSRTTVKSINELENSVLQIQSKMADMQVKMTRREEIKIEKSKSRKEAKKQNEEAVKNEMTANLCSILGMKGSKTSPNEQKTKEGGNANEKRQKNKKTNKNAASSSKKSESSVAAEVPKVMQILQRGKAKEGKVVEASGVNTPEDLNPVALAKFFNESFMQAIKDAGGSVSMENMKDVKGEAQKEVKREEEQPLTHSSQPQQAESTMDEPNDESYRPPKARSSKLREKKIHLSNKPQVQQGPTEAHTELNPETVNVMRQIGLNPTAEQMPPPPQQFVPFNSEVPPPYAPFHLPPGHFHHPPPQHMPPTIFYPPPPQYVVPMSHYGVPPPMGLHVNQPMQGHYQQAQPPISSGNFFGNSRTTTQIPPHQRQMQQERVNATTHTKTQVQRPTKGLLDLKPRAITNPSCGSKYINGKNPKPVTVMSSVKVELEFRAKPEEVNATRTPLRESPIMNELAGDNTEERSSDAVVEQTGNNGGGSKKRAQRQSRVAANFAARENAN